MNSNILSTRQAADLAGCSQQVIIRMFDKGAFEGYGFKVPGSRFRRIQRAGFLDWLKRQGIPVNEPAK